MCSRSVQEVTGILESAKLTLEELIPSSQELHFDPNFSSTDLRLLELEKEILDSIQVGDRLVIRGEDGDSAVLCTRDTTFELKDVETSNSLLIFKQLSYPEDVNKLSLEETEGEGMRLMEEDNKVEPTEQITNCGRNQFIGKRSILLMAHSYYELTKIKPNLRKLHGILEPSSYNGSTEEDSNTNGDWSITLENLLDRVPGSEKEITDFLSTNMRTFESDGEIRLVGDDYVFRVLSQVLSTIDSYSWETKDINKEVVLNELLGLHPKFILDRIFHWFFVPQTIDDKNSGSTLYSMNEYEINRFLGAVILKSGRRFTLQDFLLAWADSVPQGLTVNLNQLQGIGVSDVGSNPQVIWYFPEEELPDTIQDRFRILFETKATWRQDEVMPYVESLSVSTQSASLLLTKNSRVQTIQGIKYYSSKYAK